MFGLGAMEIAVILLLALIVLGPEKLPEVARKMARFTGELRRVSDEVRRNFDEASRDMENLRKPVMEPPKPRAAPQESIAQGTPATEPAKVTHEAQPAQPLPADPSMAASVAASPAVPNHAPEAQAAVSHTDDKPKGGGHA